MYVTIVGSEDHECIIQHTLLLEYVQNTSTHCIHFCRHAIRLLHHILIHARRIVPLVKAGPTFVAFIEKVRQILPVLVCIGDRKWNGCILVPLRTGVHGPILCFAAVFGVGGKKGGGEKKWLVLGPLLQKFERIQFIPFCNVPCDIISRCVVFVWI